MIKEIIHNNKAIRIGDEIEVIYYNILKERGVEDECGGFLTNELRKRNL